MGYRSLIFDLLFVNCAAQVAFLARISDLMTPESYNVSIVPIILQRNEPYEVLLKCDEEKLRYLLAASVPHTWTPDYQDADEILCYPVQKQLIAKRLSHVVSMSLDNKKMLDELVFILDISIILQDDVDRGMSA